MLIVPVRINLLYIFKERSSILNGKSSCSTVTYPLKTIYGPVNILIIQSCTTQSHCTIDSG